VDPAVNLGRHCRDSHTARKGGSSLSILLVEQNIEFAAALAQRAYVMDMGNILSDVSQAELKSRQLARDLMSST
jgi:ABC-type branched-subunit amino acid transport system ATPase component